MRNGFLAAFGALALGGAAAFGQSPPAPTPGKGPPPSLPPVLPAAGPSDACCASLPTAPCEADAGDGWGRATFFADYLVWWVRKGPTPGPLLTVGSASDTIPGALGQPHTGALFGGGGLDYGAFSGLRLGGTFGLAGGLALDGSYFILERRSTGVSAASDAGGSPLIARPVINDVNGLQESYSTSFPGEIVGRTDIISHTQLQGFDINLAASLTRCPGRSLDVLVGYRRLDVREDLLFHDALTPLVSDDLTFLGASVNPPSSLADFDGFRTRNHFNGGQLGARWQRSFGHFDVGVTGKLALGATDERVQIEGASLLLTPGAAPTAALGGILAQQGNIGTYSHSTFSAVSEVGLNLGWRVTENLSATMGYTFLYWTHVARPGAQIDPRVNPFAVPTDQDFGGGPATGHPLFSLHTRDFWAQGLNFGVTLRF